MNQRYLSLAYEKKTRCSAQEEEQKEEVRSKNEILKVRNASSKEEKNESRGAQRNEDKTKSYTGCPRRGSGRLKTFPNA